VGLDRRDPKGVSTLVARTSLCASRMLLGPIQPGGVRQVIGPGIVVWGQPNSNQRMSGLSCTPACRSVCATAAAMLGAPGVSP
jgi:hypothetical protein